jgi:hypothetical protein
VTAISGIREQLIELKGRILEDIVSELRKDVVGRLFDDDAHDIDNDRWP